MIDLKPCPFCGGEAEYYGECEMIKMRCSNYDCQAELIGWFDEPDDAAQEWNRRADNFAELQKYKQAEAEGRLAVFPCKIGDIVYPKDFEFYQEWCDFCVYERGCDNQCKKESLLPQMKVNYIITDGKEITLDVS